MKCYACITDHSCGLDAGHDGDHYCQSCDARYTYAEADYWASQQVPQTPTKGQDTPTTNTPKGA
jgi:hypothetical protein